MEKNVAKYGVLKLSLMSAPILDAENNVAKYAGSCGEIVANMMRLAV